MTNLTIKIDTILENTLQGNELTISEGVVLLQTKNPQDHQKIQQSADQLRQKQVGETVTYVVNRNINFTNICEQHCNFCAFRRDQGDKEAFWLTITQILEKADEAVDQGATEICMQGGLNPYAKYQGSSLGYYLQLVRQIKTQFPQLHLHAFSPQEIQFIAREDHLSYADVMIALRDSGLGSMPGTAAEVLEDRVRQIICPEKINTDTWLEIVTTAHRLGIPTTSTLLCGHIETAQEQINHLEKLKLLQKTALENDYPARITEFILLPFVGQNAPSSLRKRVGKDQPNLEDTLLLTAVARLFLGNYIVNHQPSWVKLGLEGAVQALEWGCNDIGGTLMEEHITTMAGAKGGTSMTVEKLQKAIQTINRPYQQRGTLYNQIMPCLTYF